MQSDTIIGIVGAVVLVAVMVGVFAYEYNNAPEPGDAGPDPTDPAAMMASFEAANPGLNATDDLDGDGQANYLDDDIDGDGIVNADDDDGVAVHKTFTGSVAARNPSNNPVNNANTFVLGQGHKGGTITVTWATTNGPTGAALDDLVVSVSGGDVVCDNAANGAATCDLAAAGPGTYTIEVRHAAQLAPQAKSFSGDYHIQY